MKLTSVLFLAAFVFVSVSARPCDKPHHKHHKNNSNTEVKVNKETSNKETYNTNVHNVDNSQNNSKTITQTKEGGKNQSNGLNLNLLGKTSSEETTNQIATIN